MYIHVHTHVHVVYVCTAYRAEMEPLWLMTELRADEATELARLEEGEGGGGSPAYVMQNIVQQSTYG